MGQAAVISQEMRTETLRNQNLPRPNGMSELDLLRGITGGFASFGNAVRLSALSDAQKSKVLAHLADASTRMMEATNAYLFELGQVRKAAPPGDAEAPDEQSRARAVGTQAVAAALLVAG